MTRDEILEAFCKNVPTTQLERATAENVGLAELVDALRDLTKRVGQTIAPTATERMLDEIPTLKDARSALAPFTGDDNA